MLKFAARPLKCEDLDVKCSSAISIKLAVGPYLIVADIELE